ncbi:MAG: hypothetical protein KA821_00965 [Chitinophagaceae bacterium]|nr:hypothetical protein [Chitinophagaceae bacterium]
MKVSLMDTYQHQWKHCLEIEEKFWKEWIRTRGLDWKDDFEKRVDPYFTSDILIADLIDKSVSHPRVLDVGSGPLSIFPKVLYDGRPVELYAIDALAGIYNRELTINGIAPLVKTMEGYAETLEDIYNAEQFDLIYVRNSLDHTCNPFLSIESMIHILKPQSRIFMAHRKNLGKLENYMGAALWNITEDNNNLIVWGKGRSVNLTIELETYAYVKTIGGDIWIDTVITKK